MSARGGPARPGSPAPGSKVPVEHPSGTTVLVLGIVSLVVCPIIGPVAIRMGDRALRQIDASPLAYTNRQTVVAGRILGIVSTALAVVGLVAYVIFFVVVVVPAGLHRQ